MSNPNVSRLASTPVAGTSFKWADEQEVYVFIDGKDELYEGKILLCGSLPNGTENIYRVKLDSGVNCLYNESQLIGRRYALFNKQGQRTNETVVYGNVKDALDAEEDKCYDSLSDQYHAADGIPDELVAVAVEVWEINEMGKPINKVLID